MPNIVNRGGGRSELRSSVTWVGAVQIFLPFAGRQIRPKVYDCFTQQSRVAKSRSYVLPIDDFLFLSVAMVTNRSRWRYLKSS